MYSYAPFALLGLFNILLIFHLEKKKFIHHHHHHQNNNQPTTNNNKNVTSSRDKKQQSMNRTVITMTLVFIIMTLPGTIATIYYDTLSMSNWGNILINLADTFDNMYHVLNIILLVLSNKKFYEEIKSHLFGFSKFSFFYLFNY